MALSRFPPISLSAVAESFIGGPFGSSLGRKDYVESGVPVVRGANLDGHMAEFADAVFVSADKARSLARCLAAPGDIVMTQRGTLASIRQQARRVAW